MVSWTMNPWCWRCVHLCSPIPARIGLLSKCKSQYWAYSTTKFGGRWKQWHGTVKSVCFYTTNFHLPHCSTHEPGEHYIHTDCILSHPVHSVSRPCGYISRLAVCHLIGVNSKWFVTCFSTRPMLPAMKSVYQKLPFVGSWKCTWNNCK